MKTKSFIYNNGVLRSFHEGEVWWAAIGENVGVEIDGKSDKYSRPVVILKKHSGLFFTAIPLTSKLHVGSWYTHFVFHGKLETAVLVQSKVMDVARLYERIGKLSRHDLDKIRKDYLRLFT